MKPGAVTTKQMTFESTSSIRRVTRTRDAFRASGEQWQNPCDIKRLLSLLETRALSATTVRPGAGKRPISRKFYANVR